MPDPPLVTGATGFAGGHLVEHLLEHHALVVAWGHAGGRAIPTSHTRVRWSPVDLLRPAEIARALTESRPSAIYHCAGMADVHSAWRVSTRAFQVNVLGTYYLLEAVRAARLDVPVLVVSSALIYQSSVRVLHEESAIAPSSPYGVSKLAQEMVAARASWCPVFLPRPFNHAGPRQSDAYVTSSFARQIAEIEAGLRDRVLRVGNLDSKRDITDVRDTVRAYRLIVERGTPGRPYNVCTGRAYKIADLLSTLVSQARVSIAVETDPARLRPSDTPVVQGSFERLEAATGWRPTVTIERTLADLLDYWRGVTEAHRAARS